MNNVEKLREDKATTVRRVLDARSCANIGGKDVQGEVKVLDLMGMQGRAERRGQKGRD